MKGILNFKGVKRTLTSFRLSHHKSTDICGYPSSLPKASFFEVSFLAEEGDDFFLHWMCGKNIAHGGAKGFWHDGEIVFYDERSDGQEMYRYDLQYVMPINFRLEYDHQNGMEIHLTLTALDRVYNHLLHTENIYGYFFEYHKAKDKPKVMQKEEPILYVRGLKSDKTEAQPNEKVTFSVTEYSRNEVTQNDKKRIQWAIKIDNKQEILKEKGEKLELTIKEEWAGKEILVMPFLVKPTEKVSKKTKVSISNHYKYIYIMLRSYAPFKTFGPPSNSWHGDDRVHSLDLNASFRTKAIIRYNVFSQETMARGGVSYSRKIDREIGAYSPTNVSNTSKKSNIKIHSRGGNKAEFGAPNIDLFANITVSIEGDIKNVHFLILKGTISGDDFPNHECLIYDEKLNVICLGVFSTSGDRTLGPAKNLWLQNPNDILINIDVKIKVNSLGIFEKVINGEKELSIEEWNKTIIK